MSSGYGFGEEKVLLSVLNKDSEGHPEFQTTPHDAQAPGTLPKVVTDVFFQIAEILEPAIVTIPKPSKTCIAGRP